MLSSLLPPLVFPLGIQALPARFSRTFSCSSCCQSPLSESILSKPLEGKGARWLLSVFVENLVFVTFISLTMAFVQHGTRPVFDTALQLTPTLCSWDMRSRSCCMSWAGGNGLPALSDGISQLRARALTPGARRAITIERNMTMAYTILTLSPGSTSTKVAVFQGNEPVFKLNVTHPAEELAQFDQAADQFEYRKRTILAALEEKGGTFPRLTPTRVTAGPWGRRLAGRSRSTRRFANTS